MPKPKAQPRDPAEDAAVFFRALGEEEPHNKKQKVETPLTPPPFYSDAADEEETEFIDGVMLFGECPPVRARNKERHLLKVMFVARNVVERTLDSFIG